MQRVTSAPITRYGVLQALWLATCVVFTRLFFRPARLIRLPVFLRGRSKIVFGRGFTCGYLVRLDAFGADGCIRFGQDVQLNDFVHIGAQVSVEIGDHVLIASRVFITDHDHGSYADHSEVSHPDSAPADRPLFAAPVRIGNNVWIGENVSILPGVEIGEGAVIGAGSVVKSSIPPRTIAVGVPARVVKRFDAQLQTWVRVERR